jgi:hypothetical protein
MFKPVPPPVITAISPSTRNKLTAATESAMFDNDREA